MTRGVWRIAVVGAGLALAACPVLVHGTPARAEPLRPADAMSGPDPGSGLGGFRVHSAASGIEVLYDDGSEVDATLPDADTQFATGLGSALASDAYPGPIGGNPGASLQQFLGADLPPQVIALLATLSYPVKAQAYSGGPNDASFPQDGPPSVLSDVAHADSAGATATGTIVDLGEKVSAVSTTAIGIDSVATTATSTVSDISIAGLIHIGQITSTATASSDGIKGAGSASTEISGLTIGGLAVSLQPTGITLGSAHVPLNLAGLLNPALKALGVTITQSPSDRSVSGTSAVEQASSLTIGIKQGATTFLITVGGAEADADATAAYVSPPVTAGGSGSTGGTNTSSGNTGVGLVTPPIGPTSSTPVNTGTGTGGPSPSAARAPSRSVALSPALADFAGLKAGWVVLGLLVVAAGAVGLGKIPDDVLAEKAGASCPLERSGQ